MCFCLISSSVWVTNFNARMQLQKRRQFAIISPNKLVSHVHNILHIYNNILHMIQFYDHTMQEDWEHTSHFASPI